MTQSLPLLGVLVLTHAIGICLGSSLSYNRAACQYPSSDVLDGCPTGTVFVGPSSGYTTIQAAIRSLPNDTTPQTILVASGNYTEQVNVTRLGPVTLLGQTSAPNDHTQNTVRVYWAAVAGPSDNARTSTLTVGPAGAPYGSTDFRVYNMDFINDYAPYSDTPSLALDVNHANASFYYAGFYSYQDTVSCVGTLPGSKIDLEESRPTLGPWETPTSTTVKSPGRPTSSTGTALPGFSPPLLPCDRAEVVSRHGRVRTLRS